VHVGSIASQEATASVGYNTVKSALAAYVRSLGRELAESGVVVTGILPGAFYAPENSWRRLEMNKPAVVKEFVEKNLPRKKIADADEVLPLIFFLASKSASMMSGCCVPIDAGEGKSYIL
jgi:3-oxoacyl-[acyl-carrier protein] reductase